MAIKNQKTRSDYMNWESLQVLLIKLERDGDLKFCLLIACGSYMGLRIGDLLDLKWADILNKEQISICEGKTKKTRSISIHNDLHVLITRIYQGEVLNTFLFKGAKNDKAISIQYVNRRLKLIMGKYKIQGKYSSHFMRKTLGRRVWSINNHSEKALIILSQLFNHSSLQITRRYLGIREEEIKEIYLSL